MLEPKGEGNVSLEDTTLETIGVFSSLSDPIKR